MKQAIGAGLLVAAIAAALASIDPSFFVKDDFHLEFLPASHEIARAWTAGEFPLLTRASWMCSALAAEYQFGVFSVFRMLLEALVWLLPLTLTARGALLFIVHISIAAAGAFLLARSYGVRASSALMVAIIAGLNGWMLWWGTTWYAIAAGFAWLPWYWLALRTRKWLGAAIALYLLIAAGAPFVVLMAAPVALVNAIANRRDAWKIAGASALGLLLSAPAVLMLLEYFPATARSNAATAFETIWVVPVRALLAFVIPAFPARWEAFGGTVMRPSVEMVGALVPLIALMGKRKLRFRTPEVFLALFLLILMLLPSAGPFRWPFRWLPLFHLVLAILGAIALENIKRAWIAPVLTTAMIVAAFLAFHDRRDVPRFNTDPLPRLDASRRYLGAYDTLDARLIPGNLPMLANLRFVNGYSPMGLASLKNLFLFDSHGPMDPARAELLLQRESGRNQLLDHFGIDGLIVPIAVARKNANILAQNGWKPVASIANCVVLHRDERLSGPIFQAAVAREVADERQAYAAIFNRRKPQLAVVLLGRGGLEQFGQRAISDVAEERNQTRFIVRGKGPKALVVFRRPWMPGWRATIGDREIPVLRADMAMPAVEIPPDAEGEVRLVYRPRSFVIGITLAGLALLAMAAVAIRIPRAR